MYSYNRIDVFLNWICAISKDAIGEVRNFVVTERFVF